MKTKLLSTEPGRAYSLFYLIPLLIFSHSLLAQLGQWHDQAFAPRFRNANACHIQSNGQMIAIGGNPQNDSISSIFRSSDSAQSWHFVVDAVKAELHDLHFPDASTGYAVGDAGTIYKSTDAGQTFNLIGSSAPLKFRSLQGLWFSSRDTGLVAGGIADSLQSIYRSTDGGQSWVAVHEQPGAILRALYFVNSQLGFACGDQASLLRTTDGGKNWSPVSLPAAVASRQLHDIHFINSQTGLAVGGHPSKDSIATIIRTTDGGNSWNIISDAPAAMLRSIDFYNANEGYISGDYGNLHYSSDQGQSWTEVSVAANDSMHLYDISFYSPVFGIASGQYGKIWVYRDTNAALPRAYIDDPVLITDSSSVWVNGEVLSPGTSFQAAFEYGTTAALGQSVTLWQGRQQGDSTQVGIHLQNLQPHTAYYGRIKTSNLHGTAYSKTLRFYTHAPLAPNFDFEHWETEDHLKLLNWETAGSLRAVASDDGSWAAEVQANNSNAPGAILYASVDNGVIRALPYQGRPDSISFSARCNLAPGDTAFVYLELRAAGSQIAFELYPLYGNSSQYQHITLPLNYQSSATADSLALIFVSTNYFAGTPSTQSTLAVDNLILHGSAMQLPNSDMENWDTLNLQKPLSWYSYNMDRPELAPMESISRSPHSHGGTYALKLQNDTISDQFAYLRSGDSASAKFAMPIKPSSFNGYYRFDPDLGDSLFITARFYQAAQQVGYARFIASQANAEYALFHAPVDYFTNAQPDSASIEIRIGRGPQASVVGRSTALIDNLTFDGKVLQVAENQIKPGSMLLTYFPNPVREQLTLQFTGKHTQEMVRGEILDLSGRSLQKFTFTSTKAYKLDLGMLPRQHYLLIIHWKGERISRLIEKI